MRSYPTLLGLLFAAPFAHAQWTADNTTFTPDQLVQNFLLTPSTPVTNITYNGGAANVHAEGAGLFYSGTTDIGIVQGVLLGTGDITGANGANDQSAWTNGGGLTPYVPDPDLDVLRGGTTAQGAVLEFDIVAEGDSLAIPFVFASDEYNENVGCSARDVVGMFISGPGITGPFTGGAINMAVLPVSGAPVSINTVNNGALGADMPTCPAPDPGWIGGNTALYQDNTGSLSTQYDGQTHVLIAHAITICGETYHIKLAIADGDAAGLSDSGVFLGRIGMYREHSVVTLTANTFFPEGCGPAIITFSRTGDLVHDLTLPLTVGGTSTPGADYSPALPANVFFPAGEDTVQFALDVPQDADAAETLLLHYIQPGPCAEPVDLAITIDSYEPLAIHLSDIDASCGTDYLLDPMVTGGSGNYEYHWNDDEYTPTITVSPSSTMVVSLTVFEVCGVAPVTSTITLTIPPYDPVAITMSPGQTLPCPGASTVQVTSITGGNGVYTVQWTANDIVVGSTQTLDIGAGPPTWYVATVSDACGTTDVDSVLVSPTLENAQIQGIVIDMPSVPCSGDTVVIRTDVVGPQGAYHYLWTNDDGAALGIADTLALPVTAEDVPITLHVTDACGYRQDSVIVVSLPDRDPLTLNLTADTTLCEGASVDLWAQVTGGAGQYTLDWEGLGWNDPHYLASPTNNTAYTVDVLDECGESTTGTVNVGVEHTRATILSTSTGEDDWLLQARTDPQDMRLTLWRLDDGTITRERDFEHSFYDLEDHWVHLHVVSQLGCIAEDSVLLKPPGSLFFPNAFTPDGDGVNDTFGPNGHGIEDYAMTIYDRWGRLVYQTDDVTARWDGKANGSGDPVPGVYVYWYKASGHYFGPEEAYGHVTIVH